MPPRVWYVPPSLLWPGIRTCMCMLRSTLHGQTSKIELIMPSIDEPCQIADVAEISPAFGFAVKNFEFHQKKTDLQNLVFCARGHFSPFTIHCMTPTLEVWCSTNMACQAMRASHYSCSIPKMVPFRLVQFWLVLVVISTVILMSKEPLMTADHPPIEWSSPPVSPRACFPPCPFLNVWNFDAREICNTRPPLGGFS